MKLLPAFQVILVHTLSSKKIVDIQNLIYNNPDNIHFYNLIVRSNDSVKISYSARTKTRSYRRRQIAYLIRRREDVNLFRFNNRRCWCILTRFPTIFKLRSFVLVSSNEVPTLFLPLIIIRMLINIYSIFIRSIKLFL